MPVQAIWAWTQLLAATGQPHGGGVSGSMDVHIPKQSFVYVSTAIQGFQITQGTHIGTGTHDALALAAFPVIESYTVNGSAQQAGSPVIFDSNVDSVSFLWWIFPGGDTPIEVKVQFLFQIFGWG